MKAINFFLLTTLLLCGCATHTTQLYFASLDRLRVDWYLQFYTGGAYTEYNTFFVDAEGQRIPVFRCDSWFALRLDSNLWPQEGIPQDALVAWESHYQQHRDQFYVLRRGDTLIVFHRAFTVGGKRRAFRRIHRIQLNDRNA
ncbi:MAG: hypothetical protein JO295_11910 [Verrucomicrobia bacterium]|nr:hypothetical protein [Verrucomicrobiota bacterium]